MEKLPLLGGLALALAELSPLSKSDLSVSNWCRKVYIVTVVRKLLNKPLRKEVGSKALRKEAQNSSSEVQRYLGLGWIGVYEVLNKYDYDFDVNSLIDLWEDFQLFLLQLRCLFLELEKILTLWEKLIYFILYFSFSEFPNRLRPLCTTMPWTIWPALVVLWGVCWMFFDELIWNWEYQGNLLTASNVIGEFENIDSSDLFQVFDPNVGNISCDMSMWSDSHFDLPNLEHQLQLCAPGSAPPGGTARTLSPVPDLSTVQTGDTINPPVTNQGNPGGMIGAPRFTSCRATSTIQETAAECEQREAAESGAFIPLNNFPVHRQIQDNQTVSFRNSKHGHTEKYFCPHSDCSRSQPGWGFSRKDHLDQHLRGPHKQDSVPRLRIKSSTVASNALNPAAISETTEVLVQSKKRKHGIEGETGRNKRDGLFERLTEERRLRLLVEQENQRLRQKVENYEERMRKYEERFDRMMNLIEELKGQEKG